MVRVGKGEGRTSRVDASLRSRVTRPARSARSQGQADDDAEDQAEAEGRGDRLARVLADHVLGHLVAAAGLVADLLIPPAEPVAGLADELAGRLGHLGDRRAAAGGQVVEELLDRLAGRAG